MTPLRKIKKIWSTFRRWQPFTTRGFLAIVLALYSLKVFALPENDIIAYLLGGGILGLVLLVTLISLLMRFLLGKNLKGDATFDTHHVTAHDSAFLHCLSGSDIPAMITLKSSNIAPFFFLEVCRIFEHEGAISPSHLIKGLAPSSGKRQLFDTVFFPHRGLWSVKGLRVTLGDALGFVKLSWEIPITTSLEVSAPLIPIRPLPIVAASSRAGDELSYSRERSGDLFDIKAYDPSDGINRILWKTFARSGELVVRRPEPAVFPEGEVAIYLIAKREDDHVAGAFQSYFEQLQENQIAVLFGTDVDSDDSLSLQICQCHFCTRPEDIRQTIARSVWNMNNATGNGFETFLKALETENHLVERVVIFAPEGSDHRWLETVTKVAASRLVKLTIALARNELKALLNLRGDRKHGFKKGGNGIGRRIFEKKEKLFESLGRLTRQSWLTVFSKKGESDTLKDLVTLINRSGAELLFCESTQFLRESVNKNNSRLTPR